MSETRRREIERDCIWRIVDAGQSIAAIDDEMRDAFLLVDGIARASMLTAFGRTVAFGDIRSGVLMGEIAAIDGRPRMASYEAVTRCVIAQLPQQQFLELVRSEPDLAMLVLKQVASNVRTLQARVLAVSTQTATNRVQAELLRLARAAQRVSGGEPADTTNGRAVILPPLPTHSVFAARISSQREAVTRELNRLRKLGVLQKRGSRLIVADIDRLQEMVSGSAR